VPFNVLNQSYDPHTTALNALEGMIRVWPELETAPLFQTLFLASVTTLIACKLPISPYLYHILTDGQFRNTCLQEVSDPLIHLTFKNYYEKLGRDQVQAAGSTLRRAFLLSYSPVIRNALGQPDNWLDFRAIMNSGKSIIISLGGLEDETKRLIGAMLMVAIEQAALSRVDISQRRPFTLLVDEWGSFAAQDRTIATILSQCRKFQLRVYLAAQSLSQVSTHRLAGALENCRLMIAFALGRASAEIQAKEIGFADPFAKKEEALTPNQHSQYQSITDQFETWNQELMNLPTRCCYVKVQGREAVKITSLRMQQPKVDQRELGAVLGEYKNRYQRSKEEASALLKKEADDRQALYGKFPTHAQSAATPSDSGDIFQNPFALKDKEKPVR
jgi:type IV secretory pathway TraG/TraD family ATPase VirD4